MGTSITHLLYGVAWQGCVNVRSSCCISDARSKTGNQRGVRSNRTNLVVLVTAPVQERRPVVLHAHNNNNNNNNINNSNNNNNNTTSLRFSPNSNKNRTIAFEWSKRRSPRWRFRPPQMLLWARSVPSVRVAREPTRFVPCRIGSRRPSSTLK